MNHLFTAVTAGVLGAATVAAPLALGLRTARRANTHDAMTGLYNRAGFTKAARKLRQGPWWLVMADCNAFKAVNDTLGHDAGDEVLKALAARMRRLVAASGAAARFGGDEFVIICRTEQLAAIGAGVLAVTATGPEGQAMTVSMAAGATAFDPAVDEVGLRLGLADAASYRAKAAGVPLALYAAAEDDHPATEGTRPAVRVRDLDRWTTEVLNTEAVAA